MNIFHTMRVNGAPAEWSALVAVAAIQAVGDIELVTRADEEWGSVRHGCFHIIVGGKDFLCYDCVIPKMSEREKMPGSFDQNLGLTKLLRANLVAAWSRALDMEAAKT